MMNIEEDDDMDGIEDDSEKINLEEGMQEEIKDDAKVVCIPTSYLYIVLCIQDFYSLQVYKKHAGPVYSLSVNPVDPRIILSGGGDDVGVIWNREDGSTLHTLSGHQDSVVAVGFSADGMYAATGGYDGVVKIWETASGKLVQSLEGPSQEVEWINWHKKVRIIYRFPYIKCLLIVVDPFRYRVTLF
jgi:WD40 repeat protein